MYETFYQLSSNPFRLTPDPHFCFAHASHKQAHAYLEYALKLGEGFIIVTGRPGTGKTTLIESFIKGVELNEAVAARIAASNLEATDLLRAVAYAFGIDAEGLDKATLRLRTEQYFIQQQHAGRRALLFIDEAQGLEQAALEELRLLADLQSRGSPLLQLFLVGQDSLRELMSAPDMEQFQQRVIGTCFLEPLSLVDTRGYVEHRLRQANWKGDPEITGAALVAIYQQSRGVPRHINTTCTRLLLQGVMEGKHRLDEADVLAIAADLREEQLGPLECNEAECAEAIQPIPMPELEDGSVSLAALAVRMDAAEMSAGAASAAQSNAALDVAPRPSVTVHLQTATPGRQPRMPPGTPAGLWPHLESRARGARIKLGAILIATLSLAVLLAYLPPEQTGERGTPLTRHSGRTEPQPEPQAVPGNTRSLPSLAEEARPSTGTAQLDAERARRGDAAPEASAPALAGASEPRSTGALPENTGVQQAPVTRSAAVRDGDTTVAEEKQRNSTPPQPSVVVDSHAVVEASVEPKDDAGRPQVSELAAQEAVAPPAVAEQSEKAPVTPAATRAPATVAREQKITRLMTQARQALKENRLLIPPGNSAYGYYQEVLELQPGNAKASQGIEHIIDRYLRFARRAFERRDDEKAQLYIRRGLRIDPDDRQLLALQQQVYERIAASALFVEPGPQRVTAEAIPRLQPEDPATVEPENFLQRVKAFFTRGQRRDDGHPARRK